MCDLMIDSVWNWLNDLLDHSCVWPRVMCSANKLPILAIYCIFRVVVPHAFIWIFFDFKSQNGLFARQAKLHSKKNSNFQRIHSTFDLAESAMLIYVDYLKFYYFSSKIYGFFPRANKRARWVATEKIEKKSCKTPP